MDEKQRINSDIDQLKAELRRDLIEFLNPFTDSDHDALYGMALIFAAGWRSGRKLINVEMEIGDILMPVFDELAIEVARDVYRDLHSTSTDN